MAPYNNIKDKSSRKFKRLVGVSFKTFRIIVGKVGQYIEAQKEAHPTKRRGKKSNLSLEDQVLITLYYLRHYTTFDNLSNVFGISESYANKKYHEILNILLQVLDMPDRKALMDGSLEVISIDVTEQPIERPKRGQKSYYSGKKKRHTIKVQLIVCMLTLRILAIACQKGKVHDFRILKESQTGIHPSTKKLVDLGYQGIHNIYENTQIPFKKPKNGQLTDDEKKFNRQLAQVRVKIEHVNRRCKIFRITKETYRGKHKNYGKTWNIIGALINLRYAL